MTQGEKELLLKDLCARLIDGVKVHIEHDVFYDEIEPYDSVLTPKVLDDFLKMERLEVKPYLRPMSSMTEEEFDEFSDIIIPVDGGKAIVEEENSHKYVDFCNAHHFDYRGLIPMGLALESPEGMYC